MSTNDGSQGVSNCYVFKSQLQEYAQKVGLSTPVYDTIKEGPSHEPSFRSTVIVNDVRYDSLPGFFNRKAAEQSAAEVALLELANSGNMSESISQPVQETGLCKNLLQEYAQKMNYAIPSYTCRKEEKPGKVPLFSCTVEIGGLKYIGAAARTKKEAEIKAARTALLAIQSSASTSDEKDAGNTRYTVIPCKKKSADVSINQETAAALKPKKGRFKRKPNKKRHAVAEVDQIGTSGGQAAVSGLLATIEMMNSQDETSNFDGKEREVSTSEGTLFSNDNGDSKIEQSRALNSEQTELHTSNIGIASMFSGDDLNALVREVNKVAAVEQVPSMVNNFTTCQGEVPSSMDGLKQMACSGNAGSNQGHGA
ncbi:double-stranded RNA-binding protein 1-like [Cornus florida]|uniref:double-stranded RNA-binding protein 1-like n=1 Tax=Cornus florida TaxID=4283 RepID=UPI00289BE8FE|nr:double-stranded RNA-binding protein 1-like [Cornus florida]